jgi:hypothetical protein
MYVIFLGIFTYVCVPAVAVKHMNSKQSLRIGGWFSFLKEMLELFSERMGLYPV